MVYDANDVNPMHRRIPGEAISRQPRPEPKQPTPPTTKKADEVLVKLSSAIAGNSEARLKWLARVCTMAEEGKAAASDVYDIVASRKFIAGLNEKVGRQMQKVIKHHLKIFSDRQQRYLFDKGSPLMSFAEGKSEAEEAPTVSNGSEKPNGATAPAVEKQTAPVAKRTFTEKEGESKPLSDIKKVTVSKGASGGVWQVVDDLESRLARERREEEDRLRKLTAKPVLEKGTVEPKQETEDQAALKLQQKLEMDVEDMMARLEKPKRVVIDPVRDGRRGERGGRSRRKNSSDSLSSSRGGRRRSSRGRKDSDRRRKDESPPRRERQRSRSASRSPRGRKYVPPTRSRHSRSASRSRDKERGTVPPVKKRDEPGKLPPGENYIWQGARWKWVPPRD